jgi:hypothetical protein
MHMRKAALLLGYMTTLLALSAIPIEDRTIRLSQPPRGNIYLAKTQGEAHLALQTKQRQS